MARFHALQSSAPQAQNCAQWADQAMQGALPGSSAGGKQPKFCCVSDGQAVIVKFSPAGDSPADQRWRDLLVCEHIVLLTLIQGGIEAAATAILGPLDSVHPRHQQARAHARTAG